MSNKRNLKSGVTVPELDSPVVLEIKTKCPNKWKLVDLETGEEYIGTAPGEHHMFWRKVKG